MEQIVVNGSESQVVVDDSTLLQKKISAIRLGGPAKLQVIADFDGTLTKYRIDGCRGQGSYNVLQQEDPEFNDKRQKLYEYYQPLEFDPTIPLDEKTKLMEEWWGKTHALLIEGGVTYNGIQNSVAKATIAFRDGVTELLELLEEKGVPVLIFSAGLADIIEEVLKQKVHRSFKNVRVVSNRMVFDENGHLQSFKGKTIHVLNKNEHALDMAAPLHDHFDDVNGLSEEKSALKKRTNVLLLGDHIGDLGMSDGLDYETRISVGFLNDRVEDSLESYRKAFDILYLVLKQKVHRSFKNVRVVSNRMVFDENGHLQSFKGKIIHVLNKNEHALDMAAPLLDHFDDVNGLSDEKSALKKRTNVLLLGDHIGDLGMSDGLDYETRISVGFLNDRVEDSLESYGKAFDILYLNDSSMHGVLKLATHLCSIESN